VKPSACREILLKHVLAFILLLSFTAVQAVVVRDDVADARHLVPESEFPALVDLPGEGQGVLIAKEWVVTAAHATQGYALDQVMINGKWRDVAELIVHPGFRKLPEGSLSGDAAPMMAKLAAMQDIALIKLSKPVDDVKPVALYTGSDEQGATVEIYGKGATGNGLVGQYPHSPHRGKLRRAYNRITDAHEQWLDYTFDCGSKALSLEGVMGDGDSGGPVLIKVNGAWTLAGLADWKHWKGDLSHFRAGVCGQTFSNIRISHYAGWINGVIAAYKP
jgi:hypothetical protein